MIRFRPYPLWILACISACGGTTQTNIPEPEAPEPVMDDNDKPVASPQGTPQGGPDGNGAASDDATGMGVPPGIDTDGPSRAVPPGIQCEPTQFVAAGACFADANAACQSLSCPGGCVTLETAPAQVRCK